MARKSVNIDIRFPSKQKANQELNQLLETLSKANKGIKIDLSMSEATKTFKEFSSMLDKVGKQLSNFGAWDKFFTGGAITEEIKNTNKLADAIGNLNEKSQIAKRERDKVWQNKNADASNKALEDQYKYSLKLEESINKMQSKLNISKGNSLVNTSVIDNLQAKLNSINTNTPEKEINELKQAINNLSSSDSQIVRIQNAISNLKTKMEGLNGKYGTLVGGRDSINQLESYKSKIQSLQSTLQKVKSGDVFDGKKITSKINEANNSFRALETSVKNSSNALRLSQRDAVSFGMAFKDMATKIGMFSLVYSSINLLRRSLREGIQSVIGMDSALSNLNKVVDMSKTQLLEMRDVAVSLGKELGRSSIEVANAQAEFGRMYKDAESINELTKTSVMGANVMDDVTSAQVAKGLTTIITSMKLEAKDSMRILDSMNEIQNNYRIGADDLLEALAEVGSVAYTSGASLEKVQGYITSIAVATGQSGSEIGNALRSVMSRIYKIGEEGMEAEGKPEKMLQDIGVAVRDAKGEFRDFPSILDDLNIRWKEMSDTEKIATAQVVAGVHRYNQFMSLMNNYQMAIDSTSTALNSQGSAMKENEIYMESAQAKLGILKTTMQEFMYSLIDSDMLKSGIDGLTGLVGALSKLQNTFGSVGLTVGTLSTAFLMFTNNPLKSFAKELVVNNTMSELFTKGVSKSILALKEMGTTLVTTKSVSATTSVGIKTLGLSFDFASLKAVGLTLKTVALQATLSLGLSFAISSIIGLLSKLSSDLKSTEDSMNDATTKVNELNDATKNMKNMEVSLGQYEKIQKQLEDTNLTTEERNALEQKGSELKETMIGIDGEAGSILANNNLTLETKVGLMRELVRLKQQEKADEMDEELSRGSFFGGNSIAENKVEDASKSMEYYIEQYKKVVELQKEAQGKDIKFGGDIYTLEQQNKLLDEFSEKITGQYSKIALYNSQVQGVIDANGESSVSLFNLSGDMETFVQNLLNTKNKVDTAVDETNNKLETLGSGMKTDTFAIQTKVMEESLASLGVKAEEVEEKMSKIDASDLGSAEYIKTATEAYVNATSEVDSLYQMINKLNDAQSMTPELITSIAGKYPEIGSAIFSTAETQDFLNNKISAMESIQSEAYQIMVGNDQNYYNSLLQNADSLQQQFNQYASDFVDVNSEAYDFDVRNYSTLNEAKAALTQQLNPVLAQWLSNLVGGSASSYETDLQNFTSLAQQKAYVLQKLDEQIAKVQSNYDNLITRTKSMSSLMPKNNFLNKEMSKRMGLDFLNEEMTNVGNQLDNLKSERQRIETSFAEFNKGFSSNAPNFSASDYAGSGSGGKGNGSGGGSKKDSAAAEKQVENIENLKERYYELDNALKDVENSLSLLDSKMKNANDKEKIKLIQEEVQLLNKKRIALQNILEEQEKQRQDDRTRLNNMGGFTFYGDGTIANYEERMDALQQYANSFSDPDAKKDAQDYYKEIAKQVKDYTDLIKKSIPDTINKIDDVRNEIISAQKEVADILKKQVDDYKKKEEEKTKKVKDELSKRKELMNKSWEEEDKQDELSEKQKKLNQLEADLTSALRTGDESMAYNIRQQIKEAQDELNKFINQAERDLANETFDKAIDAEDEALKVKLDQIEKQLGDEDILALVQVGVTDLSDALGNIDKSTNGVNRSFAFVGDTVANVGNIIGTTWVSGIQSAIDKAKEFMDIFPNSISAQVGVNSNNLVGKQNSQGNTIHIHPSEVIINGANKEEIRREIDKMSDAIFDQVIKTIT